MKICYFFTNPKWDFTCIKSDGLEIMVIIMVYELNNKVLCI